MKKAIFDRAKRQITQAAGLISLKGKATQLKTTALVGLALAIAAIAVMQFTTLKAAGVVAATATRRAEIVSTSPSPEPSPVSARQLPKPLLTGYADLHTHPMSHLGFGKKLVHGAPDIGSIVPKGTHGCNTADFRAKTIGEALGTCNGTHGGWGTDNKCGDTLRAAMINLAIDDGFEHIVAPENNPLGDHHHPGSPAFQYWPHQTSKLHQQMWFEWIKRAHEGGLRVMVALSVNNQLLAEAINGDSPKLDKPSSNLQITEIKSFVGRHNDFMEISRSPEDLRRIVGAGKLAVILGMEIDDFGGFSQDPNFYIHPEILKQQLVKAEIKRVYDQGVRYIFPIHLSNNVLGGTAAYNVLFNFANKHNTGNFLSLQHSSDASIQFNMNFAPGFPNNAVMLGLKSQLGLVGEMVAPCINDVSCLPLGKVRCCSPAMGVINNAMTLDSRWASYEMIPPGQINAQGLTPVGEFALKEMMKLGMMIDLDHMGKKSMSKAFELAEQFNGGYPVNLGHNEIRPATKGTERNVDIATALRVGRLGGMFGVGTADMTPNKFISEYLKVVKAMGNNGEFFVAPAIGSDANGLEPLPRATSGLISAMFYSNGFTKLKTGERTWDYTKEGVAHYGLMNEFMRDVKTRPNGAGVHDKLWQSAEYFARMWEKCEAVAGVQ